MNNKQVQAQEMSPKSGGRGKYHRDQPRSKNVRLREETYARLKKWGDMDNDVDDLVSLMLDFYEKHHKNEGSKRQQRT